MNGANMQSYAAALQIKYLNGVRRQFNDDYPLLRFIRQNSEAVDGQGEKAEIMLELGLNEGGGFHGEQSAVADSGAPRFKKVWVSTRQMTFRTRISYRIMKRARDNTASFVRASQHQMSITREAFTLTANQYLWGDGSGVMARVVSWDAGTRRLRLDRAYGLTNGGGPEAIIRVGQKLHILDTKGYTGGVSADRGYGVVAAVDDEPGVAGTIDAYIDAGHSLAGVVANDYVYLQNTIRGWVDPGETEDNRPAMGMLGFYDHDLNDTLQGLSPTVAVGTQAAEPSWKGKKVAVTAGSAIRDFRKGKIKLQKKVRMGKIAYLISSYEAHEAFCSVLDQKVEFRNVQKIDGSWDVATYDGRPWFLDHCAPLGRCWLVPQGMVIQRYACDDFINFINEDGSTLHQVPDKTVFDAMLTALYEYGITRRNTLVTLEGLDF
jgi:hypothetical protein